MHPLFIDLKNLVLDTLFPIVCLGCQQEGQFLCLPCQDKLQQVSHQVCIRCRGPSANGMTHSACKEQALPEGLISVFEYADPLLDQAIIFGKYKFLPNIYQTLGKLLIKYLVRHDYHEIFSEPMLCPIPLAKARLRWRGFNQSVIIAEALSNYFSWPITNVLQRTKPTKTQKDLNKKQRQINVAQSFRITDVSAIANHNIILVDDVITTGATALEAAKVLKSAGAQSLWIVTLARD